MVHRVSEFDSVPCSSAKTSSLRKIPARARTSPHGKRDSQRREMARANEMNLAETTQMVTGLQGLIYCLIYYGRARLPFFGKERKHDCRGFGLQICSTPRLPHARPPQSRVRTAPVPGTAAARGRFSCLLAYTLLPCSRFFPGLGSLWFSSTGFQQETRYCLHSLPAGRCCLRRTSRRRTQIFLTGYWV